MSNDTLTVVLKIEEKVSQLALGFKLAAFQPQSFPLFLLPSPQIVDHLIVCFSNSRKKKQDEEEAEQKRKATETAYQGRFILHTVKALLRIMYFFLWKSNMLDHIGIYCELHMYL